MSKNLTIAEERDISTMKESIRYDKEGRHWVSNYPWVKDPHQLPNNIKHALDKMNSLKLKVNQPTWCLQSRGR